MKWNFLGGGEIELPGPMYRNLVCPLAIRRMPGGGDLLPGQDMDLLNISDYDVECQTFGLAWPGESESIGITVFLGSKTEMKCRVLGGYWQIRINYWPGDPQGQANVRIVGGGRGAAVRLPDNGGFREDQRRPAIRVTTEKSKVTNPLDASKVQRKLLE